MGSHLAEFVDIAKANTLSILILVALTFFSKPFEFSRLVIMYFWLLNLVVLVSLPKMLRNSLGAIPLQSRWLRSRKG